MKHFATLLFLTLFAMAASAQPITINRSSFYNGAYAGGTSYLASNPTVLQGLVNITGANQTWDFTGPTYTMTADTATATTMDYPGNAPLANDPDFTASTNVIKVVPTNTSEGTFYIFVKLNDQGYWVLGEVQTDNSGNSTKLISYTPPMQFYAFPLTYQTSWNSTSTLNINGIPPGSTYTIAIDALIDGYGTLKTPSAPSDPTLRLNKKTTTTISVQGFGQTTVTYNYEWITLDHYGASITANQSQTVQSASYSVPAVSGVRPASSSPDAALSLYLSQNPASNTETTLSYTMKNSGPVQVEMMDALGRNVRMLQDGRASMGENIIPIDPKAYEPGSYFIRVTGDGVSAIRKLIITR